MNEHKLSALIREGSKKRPQAFGDYIVKSPINDNGWEFESRTCALGAAYEAATGELPQPDWLQKGRVNRAIKKATTITSRICVPYPAGTQWEGRKDYILDVVSVLNDNVKWSREQIADYLESIGY